MTSKPDFKVMVLLLVFIQLTRDLFAIAKFLLRYSKLLVENCDIFTPHLCLAAPQGVTPSEFREDLDTHKTRMNGLSRGEESMTIYSAVLIQYQRVTDRRTDGRTSSLYLLRASA